MLNIFQFSSFSNLRAWISKNFLAKSLKIPFVSQLANTYWRSIPKDKVIFLGLISSSSLGDWLWSFRFRFTILLNYSNVWANWKSENVKDRRGGSYNWVIVTTVNKSIFSFKRTIISPMVFFEFNYLDLGQLGAPHL